MIESLITRRRTWPATASAILVWGSVAMASLLISVLTSARLPTFLEVIVSRPLQVIVILILSALSLSIVFKSRIDQQWQESLALLPVAFLFAIALSWIGIWNDGSGTSALTLKNAVLFIVSFGIYPSSLGPEIFLRGTAFALALLLAWRAWKKEPKFGSAIKVILAVWVPSAILLLLQTWVALISSLARNYPIQHSLDASRVLGLAHTNSYWSNFQADRFFTGVGNQLDISLALSSATIVFLIGCLLLKLVLVRLSPWNRSGVLKMLGKRLLDAQTLVFISPLLAGLLISLSSSRLNWSALDVVALAVFAIAYKAWYISWVFGRDLENLTKDEREHPDRPLPAGIVRPDELEDLREALVAIAFVGAFLLGWPVLLAVLALFGLSWLGSASGFGWSQSARNRILIGASLSAVLVMMGGAFAIRSAIIPDKIFPLALSWGMLTGAILLVRHTEPDPSKSYKILLLPLIVGTLIALVLKTAIVLAFLALLLLGLFFWQKNTKKWRTYALFSLLSFGWIASIISQFK